MIGTQFLNFNQFGADSDIPLVILHGFFASSRNWRQIAEQLASKRRVYVPDLRNHGTSPHHAQMDYPTMTADVLDFLNQQGIGRADLLGHSMGGKIAMWFALHHAERLNKLVVADIAPVTYRHGFAKLITALKALPLTELSNRKQAETFLADAIPDLSYRQFLLQNLVLEQGHYRWRINLDYFACNADHIAGFPAVDGLPGYKEACLFLAGAESNYVQAETLPALFPQARLERLAGAGHWLHVQQPMAFIEWVEHFLGA